MEIEGKVINILPEEGGEGKNGPWRKQSFILETESKFPKKVCITTWGDKIDEFNLSTGEKVRASIEIESREFNSRWYTDVRAWRIEKSGDMSAAAAPVANDINPVQNNDDLPF